MNGLSNARACRVPSALALSLVLTTSCAFDWLGPPALREADPPDAARLQDAGPVDAGAIDAGEIDAGEVDAGEVDAGEIDAGPVDAGEVDAGEVDAGPVDAGPIDAGPIDAGPVDAGPIDAGPIDAGPIDAGPIDAGPVDAGAPDAGTADAGCVVGSDAETCAAHGHECGSAVLADACGTGRSVSCGACSLGSCDSTGTCRCGLGQWTLSTLASGNLGASVATAASGVHVYAVYEDDANPSHFALRLAEKHGAAPWSFSSVDLGGRAYAGSVSLGVDGSGRVWIVASLIRTGGVELAELSRAVDGTAWTTQQLDSALYVGAISYAVAPSGARAAAWRSDDVNGTRLTVREFPATGTPSSATLSQATRFTSTAIVPSTGRAIVVGVEGNGTTGNVVEYAKSGTTLTRSVLDGGDGAAVVLDDAGRLHAVYTTRPPTPCTIGACSLKLRHATRDLAVTGWTTSDATQIYGSLDGRQIALVAGPQARLHALVWDSASRALVYAQRAPNGEFGAVFLENIVIGTSPAIALDAAGRAYAFYRDDGIGGLRSATKCPD